MHHRFDFFTRIEVRMTECADNLHDLEVDKTDLNERGYAVIKTKRGTRLTLYMCIQLFFVTIEKRRWHCQGVDEDRPGTVLGFSRGTLARVLSTLLAKSEQES